MQGFTYSKVYEASLEYFNGDEFAAKVFVDKYALQAPSGEYLELTPVDMHKRLAKEFARIEQKYPNPLSEEDIFNLIDRFKYIVPQGSPMSAIGNPFQVQSISNCFVIQGVYSDKLDSYGGIMLADQELAQIMKRRGGVGLDISGIRPKGLNTNNSAKTTDGIAVFMERFSNTCREVAQNGRRGAEMQTISVNHPEIETFINIKRNLKKVTGANISIRLTDEFMQAVKNNEEYILRWPVESNPDDAKVTKKVKAKDIWNQIIDSAWTSAEPGLLFWDTVTRNTPSDIYHEFGHKSISTNPCFSGETLIAVADGRNAVSIKQLAEEGKDVPVYSLDKKTGLVEIKMGRNPRITGHDKKLVRVWLDDNSYVDTTPEHKFLLKDGGTVEAKDLAPGTSLPRFSKRLEKVSKSNHDPYYMIYGNVHDFHKNRIFEHRLIAKFHNPEKWDDVYNQAKRNGFAKTGGLVVHHKDYNQLNNFPDNLQIMTFKEHQQFHAEHDTSGTNNGRYSGFTDDEIKQHAVLLTKRLNRRFSHNDWLEYAANNGLPQAFSDFRKELSNSTTLAKLAALEAGLEFINEDPRSVKTYQSMLEQGYDARIENNVVLVKKVCEICKCDFEIDHLHREGAICSVKCKNIYLNSDPDTKAKRDTSRDSFNQEKMLSVKNNQARIYSQLKFNLKRDPMMKEWEAACKKENVPCRIGKVLKFGFKNFKEVAEAGDNYNHKVVRVEELEGESTVYNITVDDNHTVAVITNYDGDDVGQSNQTGVYVANCGEIVLPAYDACRLLVLNLSSYVLDPFTKKASFDFKNFHEHAIVAQRLMDDIIDLEIECIDRIIAKIEADPEPPEAKAVELNLWNKIRTMNSSGRRTGLGITALGDSLAMLGVKYGSEASIEITENIYRALAVSSHTSSCIMAEERGAFDIFNYELEKNHKYLNNIMEHCAPKIKKMWKKTGRRNIANTTTAPAGSVSALTQTTSGIEPAYLTSYVRRKKHNPSDKNARIDYVDPMGDSWQEFTVYHHGVKTWMQVTGETDITKSPYNGATSTEIDWVASVDLQAAAQKYIDHSISKTCNLPENATKELVSQVYMRAWESGCKGFTVYRDKCRDGVLVSSNESKKIDTTGRPNSIGIVMAPKRPIELPCEIKKVKVGGEAWAIFIGLLDGKPYELFGGLAKYVDIPNKYKQGKIAKNGKVNGVTTYNLIIGDGEDQMLIKDIANVFENANFGAFTRTISLALRHGTPVQYVVEQLQKDRNSDVTSFSLIAARVLKQYIADGTKSTAERKCPDCGAENSFAYQEKCLKCINCGWSKC